MNIILFGPPGAGKGTQADIIVKNFKLIKISTGDLLREEMEQKTDLGLKIKSRMDQGKLIADDIITDLITKIISEKKSVEDIIFFISLLTISSVAKSPLEIISSISLPISDLFLISVLRRSPVETG